MAVFLALLPVLTLIGLLAGLRWSAASAGLAGAAVAAAVALFGFGYGAGAPLSAFAGPLAEAVFTALTILWIIFAALSIHEYQTRSGAVATFGEWLAGFGEDRRIAALFVAWFFALFLEGAAGFGTPVALTAPLLVGLGFKPVEALVMVLLGHAAGVSFGAVGTPMLPLIAAGTLDPSLVSVSIVALHAALAWALAVLVLRIAGDGQPVGRRGAVLAAAAALAFFVPAAALAWTIGPELPTLGGALIGALLFAALVGRKTGGVSAGSLLAAALPYLLIVALILATRLIPPVRDLLRSATLEWRLFGDFGGSVAPLFHPGTLLLAGFLIAALCRPSGPGLVPAALKGAALRLPRVALALVAVLLLARLMVHSGMIGLLAAAAADALGAGWPLVAPLVGGLGAFVTGSATSSNILFADLQYATAAAAGLTPLGAVVGQGFGAGIGNIIAPHNIVAGAATVGLIGAEGKVLRRTLPICLIYAAAGGGILLAATHWAG
jgi:lactate permease